MDSNHQSNSQPLEEIQRLQAELAAITLMTGFGIGILKRTKSIIHPVGKACWVMQKTI